MHRTRISVLFVAIVVAFFTVEARLFYLQVVRGEHYETYAERQRVALLPVNVARARIVSSDGAVLAEDALAFDVAVVIGKLDPKSSGPIRRPLRRLFYLPRREKLRRINEADFGLTGEADRLAVEAWSRLEVEVADVAGEPVIYEVTRRNTLPLPEHLVDAAARLARLTGEPRDDLIRKVIAAAMDVARLRTPVHVAQPIIRGVGLDVVIALDTHPAWFRGFQIRERYQRTRPSGPVAPHPVGYLGTFAPADVEAAVKKYRGWPGRAYFMNRRVGRTGIERVMDEQLRGEFGMECIVRDYLNRRQAVLADAPATAGRDVVLTLDVRLQRLVEEALGDTPGAAVFIDATNGHLLAIVSSPGYDPACLKDRDRYQALRSDPARPLFNRTVSAGVRGGGFPLGSVFKVVTALAALESDTVPTSVNCTGSVQLGRWTFHCHRRFGHGPMDLTDAIKYSCNVFFYRTAQRVGDTRLIAMARRLGFGQPTGVRIPGESGGNLPLVARGGELLNLAIGQGRLVVTPVQVARMMAVVANDGVLVPPTIIRELRPFDSDGPVATSVDDGRRSVPLGLSKRAIDAVRLGLYKVVNEYGGTGSKAFRGFNRPFKICGKTSTAQRGPGRDNVGWFAGFAPQVKSRIAFAVMVEHLGPGQGGGSTAGPIARAIFDRIPLDLLGLDAAQEAEKR